MDAPLLEVRRLTLCAKRKRLLDGVSFSVGKGECFALVGESGSGKSLTSLAVLRLLPNGVEVKEGDVLLGGSSLFSLGEAEMCRIRGRRIAMIFQEPMNALNPVKPVGEQIVEAIRLHFSVDAAEARRRAVGLLEEVRIPDAAERFGWYPHQLSGGQKQRVMIAMALACEPELLVADEPTTALDVTVQAQILDLLGEIRKKRRLSMLFISHDLGVVARVADRIGVLKEGVLVETQPAATFFAAPSHPYSKALLRHSRYRGERTPSKEASPLLEVSNLWVRFRTPRGWFRPAQVTDAVRDVSFRIARGTTLALVGESGSGKTTVGRAILSLVPVYRGEIRFEGTVLNRLKGDALRPYRRKIQTVFQDPFSSLDPRMRIGEIIAEGMEATGVQVDDTEAYIARLLRDVELEPSAVHRYPHAFSGGQRQRIAIARALAVNPELVICDEPTSALDVITRGQILRLLKRLQKERGIAYLFITHDLSIVPAIADEVAVMKEGRIVEYGETARVMSRPEHPYTRQLLDAVPRLPFDEENI